MFLSPYKSLCLYDIQSAHIIAVIHDSHRCVSIDYYSGYYVYVAKSFYRVVHIVTGKHRIVVIY